MALGGKFIITLPDYDVVITINNANWDRFASLFFRNLGVSGSSKPQDNYNFQLSPANGVKPVTPKQQRLCRKYPELVPYIGLGAKFSISQCQYQFKNRKWNCSAHSPENVFGKIVKIGKFCSVIFSWVSSFNFAFPRSCSRKCALHFNATPWRFRSVRNSYFDLMFLFLQTKTRYN